MGIGIVIRQTPVAMGRLCNTILGDSVSVLTDNPANETDLEGRRLRGSTDRTPVPLLVGWKKAIVGIVSEGATHHQ